MRDPEILCQTLKIAPGMAAAGLKYMTARDAAIPEFCIPTSIATGPGFSRIEAKQFGHEIAESQTEAIVQDDDSRHQEADIKEAGRTEGDDAANENDDGDDRHDGHGRQHPFDAAGKEMVNP